MCAFEANSSGPEPLAAPTDLPILSPYPASDKGSLNMDVKSVGVIGAGQMGNGIAHVLALAEYDVLLNDVSQDALDRAVATIEGNMARQASRGKITDDAMQAALETDHNHAGSAAIGPDRSGDRSRDRTRDDQTGDFRGSATASSAAYDSDLEYLVHLDHPTGQPHGPAGAFHGFHFMNPVPVMQLVELIRGIATDEATFGACKAVVDRLGKTAASAEDFPAFIVNRILMPMINEAVYTLYEGVGNVQSIDQSMKLGANHPMGPLELADFIGLDTCLAIMNVLHEGLADTKYRPCPLADKICRGRLAGPQDRTRVLRLSRRSACSDAVSKGASPLARISSGLTPEIFLAR